MTKTPRTDAEFKLEAFFDGIGIVETVEVEFAQQLETELAEARAEIERKNKIIEQMRDALEAMLKRVEPEMHDAAGCMFKNCELCKAIAAIAAAKGEV